MKQRKLRWMMFVLALGAVMMLGACKKKVAPPPPPPPPPPAAPTASLTANPNTVDKGQSTTLTWQTSNATDVSIDGIGAVQASGSQSVTPADSTTYTLTAKGAGGTQQATARVTVNAPPPPPPQPSATEEELFSQNREGRLLRLRQERYPARSTVCIAGRCRLPEAASQHQLYGGGTLRRTRLDRIQSGPGRQSRQHREAMPWFRAAWAPIA